MTIASSNSCVFALLLGMACLAPIAAQEIDPIDVNQIESDPNFQGTLFEVPDTRNWYARGEVMVLKRRRVDDRSYANRWSDNTRVLDTGMWTTPFEAGGRLTLGRHINERWSFEAIGYWVDEFEDYTSYSAASGTFRQPFFNHSAYTPRPEIGESPALVELAYQSQMMNIEINARWWLTDRDAPFVLGLLSGPKFFSLEEQFQDYDSRTTTRGAHPTDSVYETFVDNNMWGGQLGLTTGFNAGPRAGALLDVIGACTWNDTIGTNQLRSQDGSTLYFRASHLSQRINGVVEFRFNGYYDLSRRARLYLGYHAMYFWSMTSAPDVVSFNLLRQAKQNNELAFWVHGPTAGLEINF